MDNILCPACQLPLQLTSELLGQEVACPRCQFRFTARSGEPVAPAPAAAAPTVNLGTAPSVSSRYARRPFQDQATSLLDLFDLSFTRYVTPLIVKITWILALILAAVWLLTVCIGLVLTLMPEVESTQTTAANSEARKDEGRHFEYSIEAPPILNRAGEAGFATVMRVVMMATQMIAIILFLLWLRVALEAVIVIFHIAASVKSIDEKTQ